jgi:DNA-binding NarL/FixJ family response regulator
MKTKKILIVDDSTLFRNHVREKLTDESGLEVVGEAGNGLAAVEKTKALKPDLVIIDIRMPRMSGIDAIKQIKKELPGIKTIILTIHDLQEYRKAAKKCGAEAYVLKISMEEELVPTIRGVLDLQ